MNPINAIGLIKPMTIEQGFNSALATGTWGSSKRKGVAQMLQRWTYQYIFSILDVLASGDGVIIWFY